MILMKNSTKNTKPGKIRRILALAGALLLFGMYAATILFAFIDHSSTQGLLKASIACTFILPVLLYAYTLVYRISGPTYDTDGHMPDGSTDSPGTPTVPAAKDSPGGSTVPAAKDPHGRSES